MATKKKSSNKRRVRVNKLKVQKGKIEEMTDKDSKRVKGGVEPRYFHGVINRFPAG